jgi:chemotaxis protein MotB
VVSSIKFAMHFKGTGGVDKLPMFEGPPSEGGCVANVGSEKRTARPDTRPQIEALRRKLEKRLRDFLQNRRNDHNEVQFQIEGRRLIIRLSASKFFDPSQAAIRPEVLPVLDAIASELLETKKHIRVEGHTDDAPVGGSRYRDNWELSAARAAAVASYMQRAFKFDGKLLAAAGFGSNRPLVSNDTPAGREANRRVEMAVEVGDADKLLDASDL